MVSEINVTPFVDVMLVLLIIFMVSAPLMIQGIDVKLPAVAAQGPPPLGERLIVTIGPDRQTFINGHPVEVEELVSTLVSVHGACKDPRGVILRAAPDVEYGFVVTLMGTLRTAGILKIGVVMEPMVPRNVEEGPKDDLSAGNGAANSS